MIRFFTYTSSIILSAAFIIAGAGFVYGQEQEADELKTQISERESEIQALEKEIAEYQQQLNEVSEEKESIQKEVRRIDLNRKKLTTDIRVTENRIESTNLNINKLGLEITKAENNVEHRKDAIENVIRRIDELDRRSLVEMVLASADMSDFWNEVGTLQQFQSGLKDNIAQLKALKAELEENKVEVEQERKDLVALKERLSDQRAIVNNTLNKKSSELEETETTEAQYQAQLAEKKRLKEEFEQELLNLESQLQVTLDPNALPPAGKGILRWPLDDVTVTQYFGNTQFAQSGGYNGNGHNGVDFRASIGTEVKSALSGTVRGTGNTDAISGCYSYGKWALVEHNNGLTTLYAHLSLIRVEPGETVSTGDVIGYSGNTGYSTGPHLHFGVYASQGVEIVRLGDIKKITNCGAARIPVAPFEAYLNPLDYL